MKRTLTLILALLMVLSCMAVCPFVSLADQEYGETLRVGTFNIQNGSGVSHNFKVLAQDILNAELDIVGLQEVDQNTGRNGKRDTMKELSEATGYAYYKFSKSITFDGGEYGTGILSRYPILSYETVLLPGDGEQRGYGHAVIDFEGVQIHVFNTHLAWPDKSARALQIAELGKVFSQYPIAILTGDLNTENPKEFAGSFPYCNFANVVNDRFVTNDEVGGGAIDNIISTKNTIVQLKVEMVNNVVHSDHYMLYADLAIKTKADFVEEDDGIRFYQNGKYVTGLQSIDGNLMYFDPATGLMATDTCMVDGETVKLEAFQSGGLTLYRVPAEEEGPDREDNEAVGTITTPNGVDQTGALTDRDNGTQASELHWYEQPSGYMWTVENGVLVIGGTGSVTGIYPWEKLKDEIVAVEVLPNTVSSIGDRAFAGLTKVKTVVLGEGVVTLGKGALDNGASGLKVIVPTTLQNIGEGVTASCKNLTVVLNGRTKEQLSGLNIGVNNDTILNAVFAENTVKALTVTPEGNGFENTNGQTVLSMILKNADGTPFVSAEGSVWHLIFADGERIREGGTYKSATMKLSVMVPASSDPASGLYRFEICNAEGENQFIPQYDSSYQITVEVYGQDGIPTYRGTSSIGQFKCDIEPIYEKRTAVPAFASTNNYIEIDFGAPIRIVGMKVTFDVSWNRYTQWQAYASNDNTLPLSKWTPIAEKNDKIPNADDIAADRYYEATASEDGTLGEYRYLRIIGTYDSERWSILFAEAHVYFEEEKEHEHEWSEWVVEVEPQVGKEGLCVRQCLVCGETQSKAIPALKDPGPSAQGENTAGMVVVALVSLFGAAAAMIIGRKTKTREI